MKVEQEAKNHPNLKVIRGNEIYLCRNGLNGQNFISGQDKYYHFILLAKDLIGAHQIMEISTRAWKRSYMGRGMRRVPTYYQDLIDIIQTDPGHVIGSSACFLAGTQVLTLEGYKNIENITSNDYIYNQYGQWERVNFPTSRDYSGEGYEITFLEGINPIKCTADHKFLITTNNWSKTQEPFRWVEAKDLNIKAGSNKSTCLFPITPQYSNQDVIYRSEWEKSLREINYTPKYSLPDSLKITPELMRLFGLWLGDGSISIKGRYKRICFTFSDLEFPFYWDNFFSQASQELNITWCKTEQPEHHKIELTSSSIELVELFYYLFGLSHAKDKFIPPRLLHISEVLDWNLFVGYALADGYFRTREKDGYEYGEFVGASISEKLIRGLKDLLRSLGIRSSLRACPERIDKLGVHHCRAYYLTSSNKAWTKIRKKEKHTNEFITSLLKVAQHHDEKKHFIYNGIKYKKVYLKQIKKIQIQEPVYCLNVDSHSFCCEGVIVHNCLGGALPTQLLKVKELLKEDKDKANKLQSKIYLWIQQMINIFGQDNFYFELQPSETPEQTYVNRKLVDLSKELNVPYIITCDSHYLKKEDAPIHKAFLNSQNGDREVDAFYKTTYLMGTEELVSKLGNLTTEEIQAGFDTIKKIEQQCQDFSLKRPLKIPQLPWRMVKSHREDCADWYEQIPSLKTFNESSYIGDQILVDNIVEKLLARPKEFQNQKTYEAIEDNLQKTWASSEVNKTHWSAYFLNLQKIIDTCWEAGTLVSPGRGSGVGFILLYLLDITQINPLRETVQTYSFRFLNPSRVSVVDVDVDVESNRRSEILQHFRDVYGEDRVANVATFRTEKSKSAILTACRGLGIDVDIAQYIASLIPADRGQIRSLSQCMYGDEENDFKPIKQFVNEMTVNYPEVWQVASKIEGLINGSGLHAGGVVFVDEPFTNSTGLMRAPDGTICTALELHDIEEASLIKMDLLSINALDKIHNCLDLLQEAGRIKKYPTLKETYEHTIGVYNLERDNKKMWDMVNRHEIFSLFQMEKQSGITGIELTHPESLADLAHLNSIIRLMAQEKGGEQPLNKFARFKQDINLWYREMDQYGLTKAEQKILEPYLLESYGICESQEAFMMLVQIPECGGFDLNFADKLRKSIAKKNPKAFDELTKQYFEETERKGLSKNLCNYVWRVLVMTSRGYGF